MGQPVLGGGYASQVLSYMLFPNEADRDLVMVAVKDAYAKDLFAQEDTFSMVAEGAMAKVSPERL